MAVTGAIGIALVEAPARQAKPIMMEHVETAVIISKYAKATANGAAIIASTKGLAALAKLNAPMTGIKPALLAANGKTPEQTQTMMPRTCNAGTLYATNHQISTIPQKQPLKTYALTPWTTTAMLKPTAATMTAMVP